MVKYTYHSFSLSKNCARKPCLSEGSSLLCFQRACPVFGRAWSQKISHVTHSAKMLDPPLICIKLWTRVVWSNGRIIVWSGVVGSSVTGSRVVWSYSPIERTYPMPLNPLRLKVTYGNQQIKSQYIYMKS